MSLLPRRREARDAAIAALSASALGRAIALRLSAEGMRVVVAGRDGTRGAAAADACRAAGAPAACAERVPLYRRARRPLLISGFPDIPKS